MPESQRIRQSNSPPNDRELLRRLYGDGKPWLFVALAVGFAASADRLLSLLWWSMRKANIPRELPPPPPLDVWLELYRDH